MAHEITGHTGLICLLGSPVGHSISPMMHNEALKHWNLDYRYLAFDVGTEELPIVVEGLRKMGARGWNLTMPCKNRMCSLADELSTATQISGAVNTIVNENGRLKGYTTDGIGFLRAVEEDGKKVSGTKMTLLGAGGAAVSICVQAALDGAAEISMFSRRGLFYDRAKEVIERLREHSECVIRLYDFDHPEILRREIGESEILVNGTSVGMAPDVDRCIITDDSLFREELYVYDVIYNPEETLLLKKAKAAGCQTQNGLNMLLYQGAAAFELWTGKEMPVQVIKEKYFQREEH